MALQQDGYPVQLSVDYPDEPLNRLSALFRLIAIIPIAMVLALVASGSGDIGGIGVNVAGAGGAMASPHC